MSLSKESRIKGEEGYILPLTMMMSGLLSLFLLHQIENYRLEKMFFHEAEQQFELDAMMKYTWDTVYDELQRGGEVQTEILHFPNGAATIIVSEAEEGLQIKILCETTVGRTYQAIITYNIVENAVVSWYENL